MVVLGNAESTLQHRLLVGPALATTGGPVPLLVIPQREPAGNTLTIGAQERV